MNIDLAISKILEMGQYTPEEVQVMLRQQGFQISLVKLSEQLHKLTVLGVAIQTPDNRFTSKLF